MLKRYTGSNYSRSASYEAVRRAKRSQSNKYYKNLPAKTKIMLRRRANYSRWYRNIILKEYIKVQSELDLQASNRFKDEDRKLSLK